MAWTAPMTAVANSAFTAAQFNAHIRDNLLETAPAKATAAGRIMVTTGANAIAERVISSATVTTQETTASTSFTDLATVGPTVTVTTGTRALIMFGAQMSNNTTNSMVKCAVAVSGATTIAASDEHDVYMDGAPANQQSRAMASHLLTTLTAGSNTFKMQYKVGSGTGTYLDRHLIVIPL
jgi:hypothetical protein